MLFLEATAVYVGFYVYFILYGFYSQDGAWGEADLLQLRLQPVAGEQDRLRYAGGVREIRRRRFSLKF